MGFDLLYMNTCRKIQFNINIAWRGRQRHNMTQANSKHAPLPDIARAYMARSWFSSLLRRLIGYLQLSGKLTGQSCRSRQSGRGRAGGDCSMLDRRTAQEVRMH